MQLTDVNLVAEIIGTIVTSVAVIGAGAWAYFHFIKSRTYRPRLEVSVSGQWRFVGPRRLLHSSVAVRNIGASVARLCQPGTGLRVSMIDIDIDSHSAPAAVPWKSLRVFSIFQEHQWIEPNETIHEDLLLDLNEAAAPIALLEVRLVWRRSIRRGNVVVFARKVIFDDAVQGTWPPGVTGSPPAATLGPPGGGPRHSWLIEEEEVEWGPRLPGRHGAGVGTPYQPGGMGIPSGLPAHPSIGGAPTGTPRQSTEDPEITAEWEHDKNGSG